MKKSCISEKIVIKNYTCVNKTEHYICLLIIKLESVNKNHIIFYTSC